MMRAGMLGVGAALVCAALAPGTADAAILDNSGGKLTYTGQPGEQNIVEFEPANFGGYWVGPVRGTVTGCAGTSSPTTFRCTDFSSVTADLGDGDDRVWAGGRSSAFLFGGPGDDDLAV